jgi:hypothetical protein
MLAACMGTIDWLTYTDKVNHFNIQYPEEWAKQTVPNAIAFLSPKENKNDVFQENVNLMLQDISQQPINIEQYTEITKKQITKNAGDSAIISLKSVVLAGQKSKELIYKVKYQGRDLKFKQYWFIKEQTVYLFTYTAEPDQYEKYEKTATEIIQSFTFTQ